MGISYWCSFYKHLFFNEVFNTHVPVFNDHLEMQIDDRGLDMVGH